MKSRIHFPALLLATTLVQAALLARPGTVLAAPKQALCAVCSVREGAGPEPVAATLKHQGRKYSFCSTACRDEFVQNPAPFLAAEKPGGEASRGGKKDAHSEKEHQEKEHQHGPGGTSPAGGAGEGQSAAPS